jgi:hypothetical protein
MTKILITAAVLFPVLLACGGATHSDQRAAAFQTSCSMALHANATAADVQQAVNDVLAYRLDACGGAVSDLRSYKIELERIDDEVDAGNQRRFVLVFRVYREDFKPLNTP